MSCQMAAEWEYGVSSLTDEASDILMFVNILRELESICPGGEKWLCVWVAY
jgi:hypothetical protein